MLIVLLVVSLSRTAGVLPAEPVGPIEKVRIPTRAELDFEQELERIGASLDGDLGIAVLDVESGQVYDFNGDDRFPQQSVSKLWVALTALDEVDEGRLELDERVTMGPADMTLFHQPIRDIVRSQGSFATDYADLMRRALTQSDNAANDRILRRVGGPDAVADFIADNAIAGVRFGPDERSKQSAIAGLVWSPAYSVGNSFFEARERVPEATRRAAFEAYLADPIDGASPIGIARALARLARGELLSPVSTELILSTLELTKSGPRRLKGGMPPDWRIAHKTGTGQFYAGEQSGYNDIGILTSPEGRRYALAVLIGRTRESTLARMDMMQAVTRATVGFDRAQRSADPEFVPVAAGPS